GPDSVSSGRPQAASRPRAAAAPRPVTVRRVGRANEDMVSPSSGVLSGGAGADEVPGGGAEAGWWFWVWVARGRAGPGGAGLMDGGGLRRVRRSRRRHAERHGSRW